MLPQHDSFPVAAARRAAENPACPTGRCDWGMFFAPPIQADRALAAAEGLHNEYRTTTGDPWVAPTDAARPEDLQPGMFGMKWGLSYGRVFLKVRRYQSSIQNGNACYANEAQYFFEDASGAEHRLYMDSHVENYTGASEHPNGQHFYFTNDSSYIRARFHYDSTNADNCYWTIYYPDGSVRVAGGANAYVHPKHGNVYSGLCGETHLEQLIVFSTGKMR